MRRGLLLGVLVLGIACARLQAASVDIDRGSDPAPTPMPPGEKTLSEELVAVLDKTQSSDVFLATVRVLEKVKCDPKVVIPAVLRNAERLRIYESGADSVTGQGSIILKAVEALLAANGSTETHGTGPKRPCVLLHQHLLRWGLSSPEDAPPEEDASPDRRVIDRDQVFNFSCGTRR